MKYFFIFLSKQIPNPTFPNMAKIEIKKILSKSKLDEKTVAEELFPAIKYPVLALRRVIKGDSYLDSEQLSKLALMLGCQVSDLYTKDRWDVEKGKSIHIFKNDKYRAELNLETWVTKIYHSDTLFHDEVLCSKVVPLDKYLLELDLIILKHEKK